MTMHSFLLVVLIDGVGVGVGVGVPAGPSLWISLHVYVEILGGSYQLQVYTENNTD